MPHPVDPAAHDTHDALLVAAFAAGDATGRDQVTASTLVATCPDCAALHRDLRAIAAALPELPAPARPRDFRITAQQAASLRPAGWRGLLATLAGPRFSFAMPLGSGLAALGLVGILVGSLAGVPLGAGGAASATSASEATTRNVAEGAAPAEMPSAAPAEMPSAAPPANEVLVQGEPVPSAAASGAPAMAPQPGSPSDAQPSGTGDVMGNVSGVSVDPATGLAVAALVLGIALVAGRVIARRLARAG